MSFDPVRRRRTRAPSADVVSPSVNTRARYCHTRNNKRPRRVCCVRRFRPYSETVLLRLIPLVVTPVSSAATAAPRSWSPSRRAAYCRELRFCSSTAIEPGEYFFIFFSLTFYNDFFFFILRAYPRKFYQKYVRANRASGDFLNKKKKPAEKSHTRNAISSKSILLSTSCRDSI